MKTRNQEHPPLPKNKTTDNKGNVRKRVFAKSGTATLMLASGLTKPACDILETKFRNMVEELGGKVECSFLNWK